jgi:undecaprenyl-diphosphatase
MPALSALGDGGRLWVACALLLLLFPKTRRAGFAMAVGLGVEVFCCNVLLKPLVARPRPCTAVAAHPQLLHCPRDFSFPSGHTGAAFAAASALYFCRNRLWMLAALLAVGMGASRLYLYVHYPTDVLAGALLGVLTGWAGSKLAVALVGKGVNGTQLPGVQNDGTAL